MIALGGSYTLGSTKLMLGYNQANSPIGDDAKDMPNGSLFDAGGMNLVGFPAIVTTHMAVGVSHAFSEKFALDAAYVMAPEASEETSNGYIETTHSQTSVTIAGRWSFE